MLPTRGAQEFSTPVRTQPSCHSGKPWRAGDGQRAEGSPQPCSPGPCCEHPLVWMSWGLPVGVPSWPGLAAEDLRGLLRSYPALALAPLSPLHVSGRLHTPPSQPSRVLGPVQVGLGRRERSGQPWPGLGIRPCPGGWAEKRPEMVFQDRKQPGAAVVVLKVEGCPNFCSSGCIAWTAPHGTVEGVFASSSQPGGSA